MLHLSIDDSLLSKSSEQLVRRLQKRAEKDLMMYPNARLIFDITPKNKKKCIIKMHAEYGNERLLSEEFACRDWEQALDQSVSYLVRAIREEFPLHKNPVIHGLMPY